MAKANGFVRSLFAAVLFVGLTACGSGDGGGGSPTPSSKLFVFDSGNYAIGSLANSNPSTGTFVVDRIIYGTDTRLDSSTRSIALDAAGDRLYVGREDSVSVFDQVGMATGNVRPARTIYTLINQNGGAFAVSATRQFLDVSNNRLYFADYTARIFVLNDVSTLHGATSPSRSIFPDYGNSLGFVFGLAVDTSKNMIYAGYSPDIYVFNNADTLNTVNSGSPVPDRKLSFSSRPVSFYLDSAHDRLYVSLSNGSIQVFDNASLLATGIPTPNRTIFLDTALGPYDIFVETTNDRLYAVHDRTAFIVQGASTATVANASWITVSTASRLQAVAVKP